MTWKKTKIRRIQQARTEHLHTPPYRARNYRAQGLPPGWRRMCKALALRPTSGSSKRATAWMTLIGAGRHWRVNLNGMFDVSERHATFDRWSNSVVATYRVPQNKTELELYVRFTTYDT